MSDEAEPTIIGNRYILREKLGAGGMGTVFRAIDRLADTPAAQIVALKRVTADPESLRFGSWRANSDRRGLRVSLTHEFQMLASLRHPNIITVRDYGFDDEQRPYFTMDLLSDAVTITEAGTSQALDIQIDLLVQALQALEYLHRRGMLHRDLKPGNLLVTDGRVRMLDFGLSVESDRQPSKERTVGTFAYMSPEVVHGEVSSEVTDLYSLGIIAFEMLAGEHPVDQSEGTMASLILQIMLEIPDETLMDAPPDVRAVVMRMIDKDPGQRYRSAHDVIVALCDATGRPIPIESAEVRESYLQTAQYVGRETELSTLTRAFDEAAAGQGSIWLIGGESGIGKSRLLTELRVYAMVSGALVLRGQGVEGGGLPFQLWRDPLQRLIVADGVASVEAASVLKEIVPGLPALFKQVFPAPPKLAARAHQQRLVQRIVEACLRHDGILVLLLEDLHWMDESLEPIRRLQYQVADRPVMVVGTYRADERADLPAELPWANLLTLDPLSDESIAQLSLAMLGDFAGQSELVELLQRESEGNAFFLVETLRALAEEAGGLDAVIQRDIPVQMFADGVQTIVRRRLRRVPSWGHDLLRLAAVSGRRIDLRMLNNAVRASEGELLAGHSLEEWLAACANAAIFDIQDERWLFSHDKLRDGLLATMSDAERARVHAQVAAAIETTYQSNLNPHYADLATHFHYVGDWERERWYAEQAGRQAAARFSNNEALTFLWRAIELYPAEDAESFWPLLLLHERTAHRLGLRSIQRQDLALLHSIADQLDDDRRRAIAYLREASYAEATSLYHDAMEAAQQAIAYAQQAGATEQEATGTYRWGQAHMRLGEFPKAMARLDRALSLAQAHQFTQVEVDITRTVGNILLTTGDSAGAAESYLRSLELARQIDDVQGETKALANLGEVARFRADYRVAYQYYEEARLLFHEIGNRQAEGLQFGNLGFVARAIGHYEDALEDFEHAALIAREVGDLYGETWAELGLGLTYDSLGEYAAAQDHIERALIAVQLSQNHEVESKVLSSLALVYHHKENDPQARDLARQAVRIAQERGAMAFEADACTVLGHALRELEDFDEAERAYDKALRVWREVGRGPQIAAPLAGLAALRLRQDKKRQALEVVEEILDLLDESRLEGTDEPVWIALVCYDVLQAKHDKRAKRILKDAHKLLHKRVLRFSDAARAHGYLTGVEAHRRIEAYHKKL
ncbi:MAG: tetratricopeptide repeat protein [Chloroflexi bacterium]|nr:tetratricopeptide repeat protein [Chloroflexota bacterium]